MISLIFTDEGKSYKVANIKGRENATRRLESIGVTKGTELSILSNYGGSFIVKVKDSKVAIGKELAMKIEVEEV